MGTTTYFVTQNYVTTEVDNEAKARNQSDESISGRIKTLTDTENSIKADILAINASVTNLVTDTDSRIGTAPFDPFLKFPADYPGTRTDGSNFALSTPQNVREGLNAVSSILKNHLEGYDSSTLETIANLGSAVASYKSDYDIQVARIDAILKLAPTATIGTSDEVIDTFDEVVKLINQLNTQTNSSAFDTYKTNISGLIAAKASNLQDYNTTTRYQDASATNTYYKLFITGGQLAIETVPLTV